MITRMREKKLVMRAANTDNDACMQLLINDCDTEIDMPDILSYGS